MNQKVKRSRNAGKILIAMFFTLSGCLVSIPLRNQSGINQRSSKKNCIEQLAEHRPNTGLRRVLLHHDNSPVQLALKNRTFLDTTKIHYESGRPMDNIVQRLDNVAKDPWVFESLVYDELRPGVSTTPETNILLKEEFQVLRKVARIMTLLGKQIYYNRKGLPDAMEHRPVRFEDFINEPWNFEDYTSMAYHDSTVGSTTSAATNSIVPTTTATINKDELQTLKKVARILAGLGNEVHNKSTTLPETTEHSTIEFEDLTRESWNFDDYTSVASEDMKIDATSTPTSTVVQEMRDLKKDICKRIESIENNKHTTVTFEDVTTVSSTINTSTSKTREESTIASINTSSSASTTITGSEIVAKDIIKALRKVSKILVILGEQVIPEIIGETSVINNLQQKP